jgi:O-antigen chain-terminating methyltransferase
VDAKAAELKAAVDEIRRRVRAAHPSGPLPESGVVLPDLLPVVHARDAAEGKVAAIGSVNPRAGGALNAVIQTVKRLVARALNWHVREQVEFNRAALDCVQALLDAQNEVNRALARMDEAQRQHRLDAQQMRDTAAHWTQWRAEWEQKTAQSEIRLLRTVSELQAAFQHRVTLMEANFRQTAQAEAAAEAQAHRDAVAQVREQFAQDLAALRAESARMKDGWIEALHREMERLVHDELRVVRQKIAVAPALAEARVAIDWVKFADKFRGPEEKIRKQQEFYLHHLHDQAPVLDLGCGRGEFLDVMRAAGVAAKGVDLSEECVTRCRAKGLDAEVADLFTYLATQPDRSLQGVHCAQVVEHLPPAQLPELIALLARKMKPGAVLAIETPNPECLAIFSTHFFIDPTHTRPVPPVLLWFYLEEAGFGRLGVHRFNAAPESMPELNSLPQPAREALFGGMDYAIFGRKLS